MLHIAWIMTENSLPIYGKNLSFDFNVNEHLEMNFNWMFVRFFNVQLFFNAMYNIAPVKHSKRKVIFFSQYKLHKKKAKHIQLKCV